MIMMVFLSGSDCPRLLSISRPLCREWQANAVSLIPSFVPLLCESDRFCELTAALIDAIGDQKSHYCKSTWWKAKTRV